MSLPYGTQTALEAAIKAQKELDQKLLRIQELDGQIQQKTEKIQKNDTHIQENKRQINELEEQKNSAKDKIRKTMLTWTMKEESHKTPDTKTACPGEVTDNVEQEEEDKSSINRPQC